MKDEKEKKSVKLTEKQQCFADEYIITLNATKSYQKAYGDHLSYNTAMVCASKLLRNSKILDYVNERLEDIKTDRIADQEEVLELLTSIARGEAKGGGLKGVGGGEEVITHDLPPTIAERTKAAELLGKRYSLFTDKQEINATVTPVFVDDIE
jgi:phage terminase small subunit